MVKNDIRQIAKYETKCTGCGACVNVCPEGAIRLEERNGYFLFPVVDDLKCSHCGMCLDRCPCAGERPVVSSRNSAIAYACYVDDSVELERSSSGGVFQLIAKYVLAKGGLVCGAKFTANNFLKHVVIDDPAELPALQRSKYLQSNTGLSYSIVRSAVAKGRYVFFVGTPCQVAGVKAVVGESPYLITADFCCHGNAPEKLFREHVEYVTKVDPSKVSDIRFRDKVDEGWNKSHIRLAYPGGDYNVRQEDDVYYKGFADCLTTRKSCADCRFARFPRQGDFTLADCWDIAESKLKWKDNNGVSTVILNTLKAKEIFSGLKKHFAKVRNIRIDDVSATNNLEKCWHTPHPNRQRFFDELMSQDRILSSDELIRKYLSQDDGVCLLNFHDGHSNYGSVLTAYALQEKIRSIIGFSPVQIHLWPYYGGEPDCGDIIDFNREFLQSTELMTNVDQLKSLSRFCRTYIVGPDVVWRNSGYTKDFNWFLFNFAPFSKNLCSYAASFGYASLRNLVSENGPIVSVPHSQIQERKRLLKRFAHISVREDSGKNICSNFFDVKATHVLDAVFLLSVSDYERIIETTNVPEEHYNARYILNSKGADSSLIDLVVHDVKSVALREGVEYSERNNGCVCQKTTGCRVGEWLGLIRNCDLFVTDSFHGICFAIIFRRQFVVIPATQFAGTERMDSLFRMLGIPFTRYVRTVEDYEFAISHPIDYSEIEPRLYAWISRSEDFLKAVLADNKPNKTRDWLESIEMSIEDLKRSMPKHVTVKQRMKRLVMGVARRARRCGIITDVTKDKVRTFGVFHVPVIRLIYSVKGRSIIVMGVKVKQG